jgi:hypothetical protein
MPIFREDLSQMEYFDYLRKNGFITDEEFIELDELYKHVQDPFLREDIRYRYEFIFDKYRTLINRKMIYYISKDEYNEGKNQIKYEIQSLFIYDFNKEPEKQYSSYDETEESYILGRTIFEAVLTNNENLNSDLKRKILFPNFERKNFEAIPFQFLLDSYSLLHKYYPETFIKNKGIFINTNNTINDDSQCKNLFYYDFPNEELLEFIDGYNQRQVSLFSKEDILNKKLLIDCKYMNPSSGMYSSLFYDIFDKQIINIKDANAYMALYYKENLIYKNNIIRIETEKLIKIDIGNLFWVLPKHGYHPMAIGKIINVIKSKKNKNEFE